MMRIERLGTQLAACLLLSVPLVACQPPEDEKPEQEAPKEARIPRVETLKLMPRSFTSYLKLTGETEAIETVTVSAELPGRVVAENFEEGAPVKAGQWLVRIDVRTDRTRVGQIQATLEQARRDLERTRDLLGKGLATPADVERAELQLKTTDYNLRLARQGVGKSTVFAPIQGVVDKQHLKEGEYANPGVPVASIVRYDSLKVQAGLPESQLRYAKEGAAVKVWLPALEVEREGTLKRIGVQANTQNRTFPLEVELPNEDRSLRAGMRAELRLPKASWGDAVLIPRDALVERLDGRVAFVVSDGKVQERQIKLGEPHGELVQVLEGVKAGEELVVVGQRELSSGDAVKVVEAQQQTAEAQP